MQNPTEAPAPARIATAPAGARGSSWRPLASSPPSVIPLIIAAVSYYHEYQLAYRNGQPHWAPALLPFTVDGLVLAAGIAMLWGMANGIRRPWRPCWPWLSEGWRHWPRTCSPR